MSAIWGEDVTAETTIWKWFVRFKAGDFNIKNQQRPSRLSTTFEDQI